MTQFGAFWVFPYTKEILLLYIWHLENGQCVYFIEETTLQRALTASKTTLSFSNYATDQVFSVNSQRQYWILMCHDFSRGTNNQKKVRPTKARHSSPRIRRHIYGKYIRPIIHSPSKETRMFLLAFVVGLFLAQRPLNTCEQAMVFCMTCTTMHVENCIYWKITTIENH